VALVEKPSSFMMTQYPRPSGRTPFQAGRRARPQTRPIGVDHRRWPRPIPYPPLAQ